MRRRPKVRDPELTDRELEILQLAADGYSKREVAEALSISTATVRTHVSRALSKLGATTTTQAVAHALRAGLIE